MIRILIFIFLTNVSYFSFCNNDYQIALNKLKEASDFFEKNTINDEQIKQVKIVLENTLQKVDSYKSEYYIKENGVLPLPAPIEITENSVQPQNKFVLTPNSKDKKDCIYGHIAQIGEERIFIPIDKRMDFKKIYQQVAHKEWKKTNAVTDEILFGVMGIMENQMINIVLELPILLSANKYVGKAQCMKNRFDGHMGDIKNEEKKEQCRKSKCHNHTLKFCGIEMSYFIENIPNKYLTNFEALVATVFPVQLFYASASIADKASWEVIARYKKSAVRANCVSQESLKELNKALDYMDNYFNSINLENAYEKNENKGNEKPVEKVELKAKRKLNFSEKGVPPKKITRL